MSEDLVLVFTTSSVPEGEIARSLLEEEGIPVLVKGAEGPYPIGPVDLLVPAECELRARLLLERTQEGTPIEGGDLVPGEGEPG